MQVLHLIRHGEGFHNGELLDELAVVHLCCVVTCGDNSIGVRAVGSNSSDRFMHASAPCQWAAVLLAFQIVLV